MVSASPCKLAVGVKIKGTYDWIMSMRMCVCVCQDYEYERVCERAPSTAFLDSTKNCFNDAIN